MIICLGVTGKSSLSWIGGRRPSCEETTKRQQQYNSNDSSGINDIDGGNGSDDDDIVDIDVGVEHFFR